MNTIKLICFYFKGLFFILHLILYSISRNRNAIKEDAENTIRPLNISFQGTRALLWLLENDRFFRMMFYQRIGVLSNLVSWYMPGERTFVPCCPQIGGGIYLAHPYATILNAKSIGKNLTIRQCTTIGNKKDGRNDLVPIIGDNVNVGANVVIIGDIRIGDNVVIGAGSVVTKNIPNNCVVAGNPAHIIRKDIG